MKRYEKYKESNVPWLGEIPEHWKDVRVASLFDEVKELNKDCHYTDAFQFKLGKLAYKKQFELDEEMVKTINKYTILSPNDIVINGLNLNYDFLTQRVAIAPRCGIITSAYIAMQPTNVINSKFAYYIFKGMDDIKMLNGLGSGIRLTLSFKELKKQYLPIPSEKEQEQIVRYLDWKVTLADKFVADKRKQIELLKEYRQTEINKAVTKGLNPYAPMHDSGIEWIGDVPAHWEYNRYSHIFQFGKGLNITKQDLGEEGCPCLNYGEIHSKYGFECIPERDKLRCIKTNDTRLNDKSKLKRGDFIFADTSEDFNGSGNFTYFNSNVDAYAGYHTVLLRPNHLVKDFRCLAYITDSLYVRMQIQKKVCGIKVFSVTKQILKDVFVYQPPIEEQQQIVAYLDTISVRVKKAVEDIEQQIKLVTEYKIALISDVVIGKVDVRDVSVPNNI